MGFQSSSPQSQIETQLEMVNSKLQEKSDQAQALHNVSAWHIIKMMAI